MGQARGPDPWHSARVIGVTGPQSFRNGLTTVITPFCYL
jgi:hypothetical protein